MTDSRSILRFTAAVLLATHVAACDELSGPDRAKIDAWLSCDECINGERAAVRSLGEKAVSELSADLRSPSPRRIASKDVQLRRTYAILPNPSVVEADYVAYHLSNYVAVFQKRAAISLGDINITRARDTLQLAVAEAPQRAYRSDVLRVVETVLATATHPRFAGTVTPSAARFGDTVLVVEGSPLDFNGNEKVLLNGAPFPNGLIVGQWEDSLKFLAIGDADTYALTISGLGPTNGVTQVAQLRITTLAYEPHSALSPLAVPLASLPETLFFALRVRPSDSLEYIRIETPATLLPMTALVDAPGLVAASMRRLACPVGLPPGSLLNLTGTIVDQRGLGVAGALVALPFPTTMSIAADPTGHFSFPIAPPSGPMQEITLLRAGYRTATYQVQTGTDSVRLSLIESSATEATSRAHYGNSFQIPAGSCRMIEVRGPRGGARVIRLILTSP